MEYARMQRSDIPECAALASRAFQDYRYFSDFVPDEARRRRFLQKMMQVEMKLNFDLMDIFTANTDGQIVVVAMLCSPDYQKPSDWQYIRAGFGGGYLAGGFKNVSDWCACEHKAKRSMPRGEKQLVSEPSDSCSRKARAGNRQQAAA